MGIAPPFRKEDTMIDLVDSLVADIQNRIRDKDPTAIERAVKLAEQYPDEPKVWSLLAYAHERNRDMDGAVLAVTRMMGIGPPHISMFYLRGYYELRRGNLQTALADLDQGIALSKQLQDERYLECIYFFRADVLVKLGRKAEARADLVYVRDDFIEWMPKRRSKADILADCEG